jgi:Exopolysaccharide biosynthesis protein related to N-acetylglucosamine-1-phosphodiester alpha-N-acetylglucosaminidase
MEISLAPHYLQVILKIVSIFKLALYTSFISSLFVVFILMIKFILKNRFGVKWHYYIWFLVIIKLLMPYSVQSPTSIFNLINIPPVNVEQDYNLTNKAIEKTAPAPDSASDTAVYLGIDAPSDSYSGNYGFSNNVILSGSALYWCIVSLAWLTGMLIILLLAIVRTLRYSRMAKVQPDCVDSNILTILADCKNTLGIKYNVRLVYSVNVTTPTLFHIIHPIILLPYGIVKRLSNNEIRFIILHELIHLKRKDTKISFILTLINIIHWFNPVIHYGLSHMRQDSEFLCDALVLSYFEEGNKTNYGHLIIKLLEGFAKPLQVCGTEGFIKEKFLIKRRITMISLFKRDQFKWSFISVVTLVLIGSLFLPGPKNTNSNVLASNRNAEIVPENSNVSLADNKTSSNTVKLYEISGKNFDGKLMEIADPMKISVGYSAKLPVSGETTSDIAAKNNAKAAINAGWFGDDSFKGNGGKPFGYIIHEGKVAYDELKDESTKQDTVGFDSNGKLITGKYSSSELKGLNMKEAVSAGPSLIINGVPQNVGNSGIAPRTAIGQKADGTVLFLCIDGRNTKSIGASLQDIQNILLEYGAVTASNLDGGSSSTMYYEGKVINQPSGIPNASDKSERAVSSAFIVNN